MSPLRTVVTFGTFDLFHIGHLRILERSAVLGRLVVGVSSDAFTISKKGRAPVYPEDQRAAIVKALRFVDDVFLEESLELKRYYLLQRRAGILTMGDDWDGKFDEFKDIVDVVYLPRTPEISTTATISTIRASGSNVRSTADAAEPASPSRTA